MSRSPFNSLKKLKQKLQRKLDQTVETATQRVLSSGSIVIINGVQVSGEGSGVQGSGTLASEKRELASFREISNSLMATVIVQADPTARAQKPKREDLGGNPFRRPAEEMPSPYLVEIEGDDNLIPMVETVVRDGRLELRMRGSFQSRCPLRVNVVTRELASLEHGGHGTMEVTGVDEEELLLIRHTGMGDLRVEGTANEVRATLSGHGDVQIGPLKEARMLELTHSGMGDVTVTGSVKGFHARLSGHGNVGCRGLTASSANVNISGMGDTSLHAKTIQGIHSGHGDVFITGCNRRMSSIRSTGMGDTHYR